LIIKESVNKMVKIIKKMGLSNVNMITETYRALRCTGYSQPKAMERVITFSKESPKVRESIIREMLKAEKSVGMCKRK